MAIHVKIFDDINKNCYYDEGETLINNCYITLRQVSNNQCLSIQTGSNGEDAVFSITAVGDYMVYETLQNINGVYDETYFNNLTVAQPFEAYTSTTPRKYKIVIQDLAEDIHIEFGHTSHIEIPHAGLAYVCSSDSSSSYLYEMDIKTGKVTTISSYPIAKFALNALAYTPLENTLYSMYYKSSYAVYKLFRLEGNTPYSWYSLEIIIDSTTYEKVLLAQSFIGCADAIGNYYFRYEGLNSPIMILNINPKSLNFLYLNKRELKNVHIQDWAMDSSGKVFYSFCAVSKRVVTIDLQCTPPCIKYYETNIDAATATDMQNLRMMGICFTDNGILYGLSLKDNVIYKIDLNQKEPKNLEYFSKLNNSGTNLSTLPGDSANYSSDIIEHLLIDYGNAMEDTSLETAIYKSKFASNGPRHYITDTLYIGKTVLPTDDAETGATNADNDGITYPLKQMDRFANEYTLPVLCYNNTGSTAKLYAWLDFNTDGIFSVDEASVYSVESNGYSTINVVFNRPAGYNSITKNTFIRLRLTTDDYLEKIELPSLTSSEDPRSIGAYGAVIDGEVEDYLLEMNAIYYNKSVDKDFAFVGSKITYTITLTNYAANAQVVTVLDPIDTTRLNIQEIYYTVSSNPDEKIPVTITDLTEIGLSINLEGHKSVNVIISGIIN